MSRNLRSFDCPPDDVGALRDVAVLQCFPAREAMDASGVDQLFTNTGVGEQALTPSVWATAILISSLVSLRPTEAIGAA